MQGNHPQKINFISPTEKKPDGVLWHHKSLSKYAAHTVITCGKHTIFFLRILEDHFSDSWNTWVGGYKQRIFECQSHNAGSRGRAGEKHDHKRRHDFHHEKRHLKTDVIYNQKSIKVSHSIGLEGKIIRYLNPIRCCFGLLRASERKNKRKWH